MNTVLNTHPQLPGGLARSQRPPGCCGTRRGWRKRAAWWLALGAATWALHQPVLASGGIAGSEPRAAPAVAQHSTTDEVNASRQALTKTLVLQCKRDADCATIGIGARACGGPEQYLAYAVRDTPAAALQQANERYAALRKKQLEERGEMSTCEMLPDPGARCSAAGQCQVAAPPGGRRGGLPGATAR